MSNNREDSSPGALGRAPESATTEPGGQAQPDSGEPQGGALAAELDSAQSEAAEIQPEDAGREPDPPELSDAAADSAPPPKKIRTGRGIAWLAFLFALAAAGGAGYLYYELIYLKPLATLESQVSAGDADLAGVRAELAALSRAQQQAIDEVRDTQAAALAATEASLVDTLNEVARSAPPTTAVWKLAEAEYLLRIANHRVLMEGDSASALRLLQTADAILEELDDFGLHPVRAQLADEILSLKQVARDDVQGLFLRLEALKGQLEGLPLQVPEYLQPGTRARAGAPEPPPAERSTWDMIRDRLQAFVAFRTLETDVKPLIAPDEAAYLELNLRLMLEQAQLAALRRHQAVYDQSLATALEWTDRYLDTRDPVVASVQAEIEALADLSLERALPDISGSLAALKATRRSGS